MFTANLVNTGSIGQRCCPAVNIKGKRPYLLHRLYAVALLRAHLSLVYQNYTFIAVLLGNPNIQALLLVAIIEGY